MASTSHLRARFLLTVLCTLAFASTPVLAQAPTAVAPTAANVISPNIRARIHVLETDLSIIALRSSNPVFGGVMSIATGSITIAAGVIIQTQVENVPDVLPVYLYVLGGVSIARGIVQLTVTPDYRQPAIEFQHMPMRFPEEAEQRARFGEEALEDLSDRSKAARLIDGGLATAAGLAILPIYLIPNDFHVDTLGVFLILGASLSTVSGILTLVISTEAEDRWSAYKDFKERLEATNGLADYRPPPPVPVRVRAAAFPLPGGAGAGFTAEF